MRTKLQAESDILNEDFRKKVIQEILGSENVERKNAALRAYEIFNGQTKKWVIESLTREFDLDTVSQMQNRATNISILRKVISKLANTYTHGVSRKVDDGETEEAAEPKEGEEAPEKKGDPNQENLDKLLKAISFNITQDKVDRFYELFRNVCVSTVPLRNYRESESGKEVFDLSLRVLPPHFYDVIEDHENPEVARVVILTDFVERNQSVVSSAVTADGRPRGVTADFGGGDGRNQIIADSAEDAGTDNREFVWWSDSYHFTTDVNGKYVGGKSEDGNKNPISELPFVFYCGDQDGSYYASNWKDKVDGAVHINVALTDMFCIAMVQGWGQPVIVASKFPEKIKGGPHHAVLLKAEQGEPEPKFYYATSSPPLDQWMRMIELEVALYLSTNNLSPTTVAAKLDVQSFPSGVAMLIERSESTADITKKHVMFQEKEPETVRKLGLWQEALGGDKSGLTEKFAEFDSVKDVKFTLSFNPPKPVVSEKEHVETLKARKDLGLDTKLSLVMRDDPSLTEEQAKKKLEELEAEATANAEKFGVPGEPGQEGEDGEAVDNKLSIGKPAVDNKDEAPKG